MIMAHVKTPSQHLPGGKPRNISVRIVSLPSRR